MWDVFGDCPDRLSGDFLGDTDPRIGNEGPLGEVDGTELGLPGDDRLKFIRAFP